MDRADAMRAIEDACKAQIRLLPQKDPVMAQASPDAAKSAATSGRKPRLSDVVHYRQNISGVKLHTAFVSKVYDDGATIDVSVLFHGGGVQHRTKVACLEPDEPFKEGTWRWPVRG